MRWHLFLHYMLLTVCAYLLGLLVNSSVLMSVCAHVCLLSLSVRVCAYVFFLYHVSHLLVNSLHSFTLCELFFFMICLSRCMRWHACLSIWCSFLPSFIGTCPSWTMLCLRSLSGSLACACPAGRYFDPCRNGYSISGFLVCRMVASICYPKPLFCDVCHYICCHSVFMEVFLMMFNTFLYLSWHYLTYFVHLVCITAKQLWFMSHMSVLTQEEINSCSVCHS